MASAGTILKQLREERGMTLDELARACNKTKGYLSKIERAQKLPPFTTLQTIALALGVEIDVFLAGNKQPAAKSASRNIDLHRHREAKKFLKGESYAFLPLVTQYRNKYMSPFLMKLRSGKSRTFTHDSEEFVYLLEGNVDLHYENKIYHLEKGDAFYLDSRIEHTFFNPDKSDVLMLALSFNYRRF
jgi:transcriptional regulator with XRE-family HTH domain